MLTNNLFTLDVSEAADVNFMRCNNGNLTLVFRSSSEHRQAALISLSPEAARAVVSAVQGIKGPYIATSKANG